MVSWNSLYQDGNSDGVFQQAYNADGSVRGGEEQVTVTTDYSQSSPAVSALPDGGWVIAWRSENQDQGPYGSWDGVYQSAFSFVPDGSEGADRLTGSLPDELISGQGGNDTLLGNGGNDTLEGGAGRDRMVGGVGDDEMHGGSDQDTLLGTAGNDIMYGDDGDDVLRGGNDHDLQHGDDGNDIVIGGTGRDTLYGDAGNDILRGNGGFDTVDGGDGDDFVAGGAQADLVLGGAGNDTVQGGGGFDTIDGGTGDDELTGNFNADTFLFADGHGADTITDFEATNNAEKIDLSGISAITSLADLNLGSATLGAATQVGADVVIDTGGGNSITLAGVSLSDLDANDFIF
ncbi:MAG: calcium-binding protein [Paracoccaceae bacterium]